MNPFSPPPSKLEEDFGPTRHGVLRNIPRQTAIWFGCAFALHMLFASAVFFIDSNAEFFSGTLLWLIASFGMLFRIGPIRRLVLLVGTPIALWCCVKATVIIAGFTTPDLAGLSGETLDGFNGFIKMIWLSGVVAGLSYPLFLLWPVTSRAYFRDRQ